MAAFGNRNYAEINDLKKTYLVKLFKFNFLVLSLCSLINMIITAWVEARAEFNWVQIQLRYLQGWLCEPNIIKFALMSGFDLWLHISLTDWCVLAVVITQMSSAKGRAIHPGRGRSLSQLVCSVLSASHPTHFNGTEKDVCFTLLVAPSCTSLNRGQSSVREGAFY